MAEQEYEEERYGLGWSDVVSILFKHKRKILTLACAGLLAAVIVQFHIRPLYRSEAKLFVPYVVDRNPVDVVHEATATSRANDAILNSEVQILTSWDLAVKTAAAVHGVKKGISGSPDLAASEAVRQIVAGIEVTVEKGMNVITVGYKDPEPEFATRFLRELLKNYREKHLEVHRFPQAIEVITHRRDEVRKQLDLTEMELKRLRSQVQVLSVVDSSSNLSKAVAKGEEEVKAAEAERRGQEARVEALESLMPAASFVVERQTGLRASDPEVERHQFLVQLLSELRQKERTLLATYPPESKMVKIPQKQISELEEQRRNLERKFPDLITANPLTGDQQANAGIIIERARLAAMRAKEEVLKGQLGMLQETMMRFSELAPEIDRLELEKQVLEANYRNIETSLGKAKDDSAVDWSKISNIATLQDPSPAVPVANSLKKRLTLGLGMGGLILGIGMAVFLETVVDRRIKRPSEVEGRLQIPLLLSVPQLETAGGLRLGQSPKNRGAIVLRRPEKEPPLAPWATEHFIRPYCEAIRDRILLSFELGNRAHKPKLIGVTSFSSGAGCSTLAGGLAAAFSEMGEGKVLVVDANIRGGESHTLFYGESALPLTSVLQSGSPSPVAAGNVYIATVCSANPKHGRMGLPRFNSLVPSLKSSDFDYIIFDLPPLGPTSLSLGIASFLDKVLVVLEAEQTNRDTVKRLYSELSESRADVSCVFNKVRSYGPKWIEGDC